VRWYSALEEENHYIGQANAKMDDKGALLDNLVSARLQWRVRHGAADTIHLDDVSPNQLVSVAASMIPFLEHDDANRALMARTCSARPCSGQASGADRRHWA